jgi:hypothetical protein
LQGRFIEYTTQNLQFTAATCFADRPKMLAMAGSPDENARVGKILPKTI